MVDSGVARWLLVSGIYAQARMPTQPKSPISVRTTANPMRNRYFRHPEYRDADPVGLSALDSPRRRQGEKLKELLCIPPAIAANRSC